MMKFIKHFTRDNNPYKMQVISLFLFLESYFVAVITGNEPKNEGFLKVTANGYGRGMNGNETVHDTKFYNRRELLRVGSRFSSFYKIA